MRAERERRHISLDAVARGTLVRQDFLELIDADRLEELPAGAYARGFIRSYVAYLGLDPKPFLEQYEQRCGSGEPELKRFAQGGPRIPPAAQKRAWQVAIGTALVIIVTLALFGAFRSGDNVADAPNASRTAARIDSSAEPNPMGAVVRIEVLKDETWVEATVDGQHAFGATMKRGEYETFKGNDEIILTVTRAANVRITANGQILGTPPTSPYRGIFTSHTETLPASSNATPEPSTAPDNSPTASLPPADGTQ